MRTLACAVSFTLAAFALMGCSSTASSRAPSSPPPLPAITARTPFDPAPPLRTPAANIEFDADYGGIAFSGPLSGAPAVRAHGGTMVAVQQSARRVAGMSGSALLLGGTTGGATTATPALPAVQSDANKGEKIEREAQLAIEVSNVAAASAYVEGLVLAYGGRVSKEERTSAAQSTAEITARVPSERFDAFIAELGKAGEIRNRSVREIDATLEHHDLEVLVKNLETAQTRYRDLMDHATDPVEALALERELERVRTELDRIKGRLDYMRDRASFATIAIGLHSPTPEQDVTTGYQSHVAPGIRGLTMFDVREGGTNAYVGAALSLRLPRALSDESRGLILDVDIMRAAFGTTPDRSAWAYDILLGFDLYNESMQAGRRGWLNPYVGIRAGFSQTQNRGDFAAAAVFGLEIVKTRALMIDAQAKLMALVGNPDGPHGAAAPSLGFDVGF